jgi:tetratricopeptide (TPR) repeat protein
MEVTKWLKPSDSGSRIGDRASVQAATRVNAEQASKGQDAVLDGAALERKTHMRATIVEGEDAPAVVDDKDRPMATVHNEPPLRLQLFKASREREFFVHKLEEALKAYRDSLAIRERLAAADRSNTEWQRDLLWSYNKVGEVLAAQGKLEEALKAYRDGLAIRERLAADRSNTVWQRNLSVSYNKVGEVLVKQGKLEEALTAYRDSLAIRERLAAADRSNTEWQRDLAVSYMKLASVHPRLGNVAETLVELTSAFDFRDSKSKAGAASPRGFFGR